MPVGTRNSGWASDLELRQTSMLFRPSGLSLQDGPRTTLLKRRRMVTHPAPQPCRIVSKPRVCLPLGLISGQLRMPASPATSRGLALALLSLMPATASTRSTTTSCCGRWPTNGTKGAGLHSISIGNGSDARSGPSRGSRPS